MQSGGQRLMVVDAGEEWRRAVADHFLARGWDVIVAGDGVEALAQTLTHEVDVVVMNATLPRLDGFEAAAILRRIKPGLRIVLTLEPAAEARPHESERLERFRCLARSLDLASLGRAVEDAGDAEEVG